MVQNKALIYNSPPSAFPIVGENITLQDQGDFDLNTSPPADGLTIKNHYFSFDPYQRGRMRPAHIRSYVDAYEPGKPVTNFGISRVIKSSNAKFSAGDLILTPAAAPMEEYSIFSAELAAQTRKVENPFGLDLKYFIGPLGPPGLTAYCSLYEIAEMKKGETIFVSAASGAVGQMVGQLAKHEGLRVVGSVGDDAKLEFITKELGFDGGFNYKKEKPAEALARIAPEGLDIYYDNVGGEQLEAAIGAMKDFGRIVVSGMISQYNIPSEQQYGVRNMMNFFSRRLKMQGFCVLDAHMGGKYAVEHQQKMQRWIAEGSFKARLHVTKGIENAADGFVGMLKGENFGKAVLEVADLD